MTGIERTGRSGKPSTVRDVSETQRSTNLHAMTRLVLASMRKTSIQNSDNKRTRSILKWHRKLSI
jgi:hypothetical protein